jgi:hypothetical protein
MNIAEILRTIADIADRQADPGRPDDSIQNPAELAAVNAGLPVENPDNQDLGADDAVMIPPLQLKMELLKRAVDVDNVFDADGSRASEAHDAPDEIAVLKKRAGIPVAAVMELSNDEPLDD